MEVAGLFINLFDKNQETPQGEETKWIQPLVDAEVGDEWHQCENEPRKQRRSIV